MVRAPYPLVPVPGQPDWRDRHPKAKIAVGCLVALVLPALYGVGIACMMEVSLHHHAITRQAVARAQADPRVMQALGQPINVGWIIKGDIHLNAGSGHADLRVPIAGPNGKGRIALVANRVSYAWQFTFLQVEIAGSLEPVTLLATPGNGINPSN